MEEETNTTPIAKTENSPTTLNLPQKSPSPTNDENIKDLKRPSPSGPEDVCEEEYIQKRFKLKRRKIKMEGAPKMPLNGYVRYMNARRETLRKDYPDRTAVQYTKIIGEEWNQLPAEKKAPYLAAAEVDRQRYLKEMNVFLQSHPDVLAAELERNKIKPNRKSNGSSNSQSKTPVESKSPVVDKSTLNGDSASSNGHRVHASSKSTANDNITELKMEDRSSENLGKATERVGDNGIIQIYTNEFLEHNKTVDFELKTLRKSSTDYEMQNDVLEKYIENMKSGVEKMETENNELQEKNRLLEMYLDKLKLKLAQALSGLAIPTEPNGATLDNIDKYMADLHKMSTSNSHGPASLNKAKDIIRKLDLHIQL